MNGRTLSPDALHFAGQRRLASHSGIGFAHIEGRVAFTGGYTDVVEVRADYTSSHGSGSACVTLGGIQIPPPVVYDTVDGVQYDCPG